MSDPEPVEVTAELMRSLVGEQFTLRGHDVQLTLAEVEDLAATTAAGVPTGLSGFTLLFEGPADPHIPQHTWRLVNGADHYQMFLVPVGPRPNGSLGYEAVYSLLGSAE